MEKTIILLDPDTATLHLTRYNLEGLEYFKIHTFIDPVQALRYIYLYGQPHLVITEYTLPAMTGIEFMNRVRTLHPRANAVIFTGNSFEITKPCEFPIVAKSKDAYRILIPLVLKKLFDKE